MYFKKIPSNLVLLLQIKMTAETSRDLNIVPDSNAEMASTEAEAAVVSAALKLSLLAREESQSRDLRLAGNSNAAKRPPHEESAGIVVGKRKPGALALFRALLVFYHMVKWLEVKLTTGQSAQCPDLD